VFRLTSEGHRIALTRLLDPFTTSWKAGYSSRIIKAGASVGDTLVLLHHWDPDVDPETNLRRIRHENVLGKATRSRVEDVLAILRRRYASDARVIRALTTWFRTAGDGTALRRLLYFHSALADRLLADVVVEILGPLHASGQRAIGVGDLLAPLRGWLADGRMAAPWGETTLRRVAEGLLATLRDFGLLEGAVHKRFSTFTLPVPAAAYVAFWLYRGLGSGRKVLVGPAWRLFFLDPQDVEVLLLQAHRAGLLDYRAAGSVVRLEFPATELEVYARAAAAGAAAAAGV
jgi:hypothetical protein